MNLPGDDRAQSIQVGAVLLFAVLILAFSTYQAFVVPEQNERVEFEHNREVRSQLADLRNAIASPGGGTTHGTTIALGTRYPPRAIALNPAPPSGTLRTVGTADPAVALTIRNATASGETGDLWDGTARHYDTGGVVYRPDYNRYGEAPVTGYEHTVLYDEFETDTLVGANQSFIQGTDLSLVTLDGSLQRSSGGSTVVDARRITTATRTVRVAAPDVDSPVTLNFTSRLTAERWARILGDQEHVVDVTGYPSAAGDDFRAVRVELDPDESYALEMTKVAVGTGADEEPARYVTDVAGDGGSVVRGNRRELTLEVRDGYNDPVAGVTVNASVGSGGSLDATRRTTDGDGRVTFTYRTTASTPTGTHRVNVTTNASSILATRPFEAGRPLNATVAVNVTTAAGGGGDPYALAWSDPSARSGVDCPGGPDDTCTIDGSLTSSVDLTVGTSPAVTAAAVDYSLDDPTVGTLDRESGRTDDAGENATQLSVLGNGTVDVYATSGGSSDTITFDVSNAV